MHGIGKQAEGDTVVTWGDVLIGWLSDWLSRGELYQRPSGSGALGNRELDPVRVRRAKLRRDENGGPPHVDVEIEPPVFRKEEKAKPQLWRIAESWWADEFHPPSFSEMAFWGFAIVPWVLVAHFVTRLQRAWRRFRQPSAGAGPARVARLAWRVVQEFLLMILAIVLSPLLASLILVMLALAAVPLRSLRKAAAGLQRLLAMTIGDSYVLLGSPSRRASIVSRVQDDLAAMGGCRSLAVVAHSQGAAVAYEALKAARPENLRKLITFGSGQTKLAALETLMRTGGYRLVWLAPLGLISLMMATWYGIDLARTGDGDSLVTLGLVGVVVLAMLGVGLGKTKSGSMPSKEALDVGAEHGWLDLYASHDPVPNGPLFGIQEDEDVKFLSRDVVNVASSLRDHTTYWRNRDEFVPEVATALAAAARGSVDYPDGLDPTVRFLAKRRRRWRAHCLRALRLLAVGTLVFVLVGHADRLPRLGRQVIDGGGALVDLIPFVGQRADGPALTSVDRWVGAVAVVVAVALGYAVLGGVWRLWERGDYQRFVRREQFPVWAPEFVTGLYATAALIALAWLGPTLPPPSIDLGWVVLLLTGWIILGLATAAIVVPFWMLGRLLVRERVIRSGRFNVSPGQWAALIAPAYVLALVLDALPGGESPVTFLIVLFAPALLGLLASVLASSRAVAWLLGPVRRVAAAGPIAADQGRSTVPDVGTNSC